MDHRKGKIPWNKGKKCPGMGGFKKGFTPWNKGKIGWLVHTDETKKRISEIAKSKGFGKWMKGKKCKQEDIDRRRKTRAGYKHSNETKNKIGFGNKGKKRTKEDIERNREMGRRFFGENGHNWRGGIAYKPYPFNWIKLRDQIRKRDNYICQECFKKELKKHFPVHHIDYNKENNDKINLITLCHNCHNKTNGSSIKSHSYWKEHFQSRQILLGNSIPEYSKDQ